MFDLLEIVLTFLLALGLLVAVHEFGHFWVARRLGVKVLRFSIGFGRPLWRHQAADGTEYAVATIPLGGYVKMLDEREGEVAREELHRAFNRQRVGVRFAIVAAGPVFNLIFAVFAYWLMFVSGVPGLKPILGEIAADTPAYEAGLREGQELLAIDGETTPTWDSFLEAFLPSLILRESVSVTVDDGGLPRERRLDLSGLPQYAEPDELFPLVGIKAYRPIIPPRIDEVAPDSAAQRAGLQPGDLILSLDGEAIDDSARVAEWVRDRAGRPVTLGLLRGQEEINLEVTPEPFETGQGTVGRLGVAFRADPSVYEGLYAELRLGPVAATAAAFNKTVDMTALTFRMFAEMVMGRVSVENIGGPITIARFAHSSFKRGLSRFFRTLALLSLSLAVLNLLPIPLLDGGHLFFYLVEMVKGSPVSERTEAVGQRIGLALIIALMLLAFYNDLVRLFG